MEWIERLNSAVNYIEEHLADEIDYEQAARIAYCSTYHFQRMFAYMANQPLSEYIRRRRMSLAAVDLQNGVGNVLNIAIKYGYDSPTAFNRAFKNVHDINPSEAKLLGVSLKAFPPISFKISIKGEAAMNYKIIKKDAFRIIGVVEPLSKDMEESMRTVPKMWLKSVEDGSVNRLCQMIKDEHQGLLGVSACYGDDTWQYYIAVATDAPLYPPFSEFIVPAATWAVFDGAGPMPQAIQELQKAIVTDWLPSSGYEYTNVPDIEVYFNADPQNTKFEVWLPVIKKK